MADLKADVRFTGTQFIIVNNDATAWTEVRLKLNDDFRLDVDNIQAGNTYTVGAMQFAKSDGTRFNPFQMKPQKLTILATVNTAGRKGFYAGGWK